MHARVLALLLGLQVLCFCQIVATDCVAHDGTCNPSAALLLLQRHEPHAGRRYFDILVWQSDRTGNAEIFSQRLTDAEPTNLTNDPAGDSWVALALNGTFITFQSDRSGNSDVWRIDTNGGGLTQLTTDGASDTGPCIAPDGLNYVWQTDRTGTDQIFTRAADGTGTETNLSNNGLTDFAPSYSPDGTKITFTSNRGGSNDVWIMNADGSSPYTIAVDPADDAYPVFSYDGRYVLWHSDRGGMGNNIWRAPADGSGSPEQVSTGNDDCCVAASRVSARFAYSSGVSGNNEIYYSDYLVDGSTTPVNFSNNAASDDHPEFGRY